MYFLGATIALLVLAMIYTAYQMVRNHKVYKIRIKWFDGGDSRYESYSYDEMYLPSIENWMGLKFPNEKDF
jgi:hypothetical protein